MRSLAVIAALLAAAPGLAAGFRHSETLEADQLLVRNLIGQVEIVSHDGPRFEVELDVQGADADPERIRIDASEGRYGEVIVEFPLGESRRYVYPRMGKNSSASFGEEGAGFWTRMFGGGRVEVSGSGRGLELWVDATIRVPRGKTLRVEHGVGELTAEGLEAALDLACRACPIEVDGLVGELTADTGAGRITARDVRGNIDADSGSGQVSLSRCEGDRLIVDTGSGRVEIDEIESNRLAVDTGSGRVEARDVVADDVDIDTGSGRVLLQLTRMGRGDFVIDTGSGGVVLELPGDASADIRADTGNGGIDLDLLEGYEVLELDRNSAELRVGSGKASVRLDTGSGSIRVSQR